MKATPLIVGLLVLCMLTLGFAQPASAATRVLAPGETFTRTVHADMLDTIEYSWSITPATSSVNFEVLQPGGTEYISYSGNQNVAYPVVIAGLSGDYSFSWTNPGSSAVTLTYDLSGSSGGLGGAVDFIVWVLVIVAIVIIVIVVVVVLVVVRGGKKKAAAPPAYMPPPPGETAAPFVANVCPKCGGPIDSQQTFCPKCGFRVR